MRRIALAVALVVTGALAAVPADAKRARPRVVTYEVTQAQGFVKLSFHGDEAAGCRNRGVCTIGGTTTYAFGGRPSDGFVAWVKQRKRTIAFYGFIETRAETASDVVSAGSEEHCIDRVEHDFESVSFEPRSQRVRFSWRQADPGGEGFYIGSGPTNVFDTRCAGPELTDLLPSRALPVADVPYRVFRSPKGSFRTTGSRPFAGGGFAGTVEWDLRYGLRRGNRGGIFAIAF